MSVPNLPAGRAVPAINPTLTGATVVGAPNEPDARAPLANFSSRAGNSVRARPVRVNTALPPTTSAVVINTPNTGPQSISTATRPVAAQSAGILDANDLPVPGSAGPPYVQGNVPVGANQLGTSVILTPR